MVNFEECDSLKLAKLEDFKMFEKMNVRKNENMFEKTNFESEKSVPFSIFKSKMVRNDLKNRGIY